MFANFITNPTIHILPFLYAWLDKLEIWRHYKFTTHWYFIYEYFFHTKKRIYGPTNKIDKTILSHSKSRACAAHDFSWAFLVASYAFYLKFQKFKHVNLNIIIDSENLVPLYMCFVLLEDREYQFNYSSRRLYASKYISMWR